MITFMFICKENCGMCCDPIIIDASIEIETNQHEDAQWIKAHFTEITTEITKGNALKYPHIRSTPTSDKRYFTCDKFNAITRKCEARNERPIMCKNFPWYDGVPDPIRISGIDCAFTEALYRRSL